MLIDLTLPLKNDDPFLEHFALAKSGHLGTHIDKPVSMPMAIERFISPGRLIDLSIDDNAGIEEKIVRRATDIRKSEFVILHTGCLKRAYGTEAYFDDHPELSQKSVELLVSKEPNMIGIDAPGLARSDRHSEVDRYCEEHGVLVVENMANLELVQSAIVCVYCFPINADGCTGLPVRIVVEVQGEH
ncbi:MAG: cyclase family protein [Candidatus Zixiibacteriota bacterium]